MSTAHLNPQLDNVAEVFFTDGVVLGPGIGLREVGDELTALILGVFEQAKEQELHPPTLGVATAILTYRAVATGNHVTCNAPPGLVNLGSQLAYLYRRENSIGGIGTVVIDIHSSTITTYGGRGFPDVRGSAPFAPCVFTIDDLAASQPEVQAKAPEDGMVTLEQIHAEVLEEDAARKKSAKKKRKAKAAKKKATAKVKVEKIEEVRL